MAADDRPPVPPVNGMVLPPRRPAWRRWLLGLIRLGLLGVVVYYVGRALADGVAKAIAMDTRLEWGWVAAGVACTAVSMTLLAESIRTMLASNGLKLPRSTVAGATWVSRLGKYIPGKVASVAGAAYLLRRHGVPVPVGVSIVLLNTVLTNVVALALAAPLLLWDPISSQVPLAWAWNAIVFATAAAVAHPRVLFPTVNWLLARLGRPPLTIQPTLRSYVRPLALIVGQWAMSGLALWLLVRSVGPVSIHMAGLMIAVSCLAVTVGFIVLFAPGGLGVRETILLMTLTPVCGAAAAAVVTILARVVYTGTEVLLAGVGALLLRRVERTAPNGLVADGRAGG